MSKQPVRLCHLDDLPDGQSRGFAPLREGRDTVFIVRLGTVLHAYRDACPHHGGTPMAWRKDAYLDAQRSAIVCHAHGARFDIASGRCTLGPCLGQSLEPVQAGLTDDGWVQLFLNDLPETIP